MASGSIQEVVLIGAGNVAWHLGHALFDSGIRISQVISRSLPSCRDLAGRIGAVPSDDIAAIDPHADAMVFAVPDDVLPSLLSNLPSGKAMLMHTAGSVSMEVFRPYAKHYGVLYPVQTFTRGRALDFSNIPLLVEASGPVALHAVTGLAQRLSGKVSGADSATRCLVHVAAVFACNFTNHMVTAAQTLLESHDHSLELLEPLMRETLQKALEIRPENAQTGPALRGDMKVIGHHLELLQRYPELEQLYRVISSSIMKEERRDRNIENI